MVDCASLSWKEERRKKKEEIEYCGLKMILLYRYTSPGDKSILDWFEGMIVKQQQLLPALSIQSLEVIQMPSESGLIQEYSRIDQVSDC